MAIFGMNGLKFLGLDALVLFALYGMKKTTLTKAEIANIYRLVARKRITAEKDPAEKKKLATQIRQAILGNLASDARYKDMDKGFVEAYGKKTWMR